MMILQSTTIPVVSRIEALIANNVFPGENPISLEIINANISIPPDEAPIRNNIPIPTPKMTEPISKSTITYEMELVKIGVIIRIVSAVTVTQYNVQMAGPFPSHFIARSEEHTSELQ